MYRFDVEQFGKINPVTGKPYSPEWSVWCLTNSDKYTQVTGSLNSGAYIVKCSRFSTNSEMSLGDFIGYNKAINRKIIIFIDESDFKMAEEKYNGHTFNEPYLRSYEQCYAVHSTTLENFEKIKRDGCLKSFNLLKAENADFAEKPIGSILGDPEEFSNYVMLGKNVSGEIAVCSKQYGKIVTNLNAEYITGVRLYFNLKKIAADGLVIRDGTHIKVKNVLPLKPYLIWTATFKNAGLKSVVSTPQIFSQNADLKFAEIFPEYTK